MMMFQNDNFDTNTMHEMMDHGSSLSSASFMDLGPFNLGMMFWAFLLILLIYFATRPKQDSQNQSQNSEDILKERYAKGEIGTKEFEDRMAHLKKNYPSTS